jgi:hypothetical protein
LERARTSAQRRLHDQAQRPPSGELTIGYDIEIEVEAHSIIPSIGLLA